MSLEHLFFIIFSFTIGGLILLAIMYLLRQTINARKWLCTKGIILSSEVDNIEYIGTDSDRAFRAIIIYKYFVKNKEYTSDRVYFGDFLRKSWSRDSQSLIKKYPKGSETQIYYNPSDPQDAVLDRGVNLLSTMLLLVSSIVFIFIGLYFLL